MQSVQSVQSTLTIRQTLQYRREILYAASQAAAYRVSACNEVIVNDWRLFSNVHEVSARHDTTRHEWVRSVCQFVIESSTQWNSEVPRGRLWFNISAIGTRPSVCNPLISNPKIRVMTANRAQTKSLCENLLNSGKHRQMFSYSSNKSS
jgi:hypothetical protein